jgi:serine/threonine protein kinase
MINVLFYECYPIVTHDFSCSGYIPPEHIDAGAISTKFDVYSFGVVIIKIMAGRDGYLRSAEMSSQQFINLVRDKVLQFIDNNVPHL